MQVSDTSLNHRSIIPAVDIHFPQKLNLHLCVRGSLRALAQKANDLICKSSASEICFSADSFLWPHITLNMGWVDNVSQLSTLMQKLDEFAKKTDVLQVSAVKLYAKEPKRSWVFIDIEPAKEIISLKQQLGIQINGSLRPVEWDVINQTPHITVGYLTDGLKIKLSAIESFGENIVSEIDSVGISFCGIRGSCVGRIHEYELKKRAART